MATVNVDMYIRVEKSDTVRDMPSREKTVNKPGYEDSFTPRPINAEAQTGAFFELVQKHLDETPTRFEKLKEDSNKIISGANYALEEISRREKGKGITVDPNNNPEVMAALNYLFGPGTHNNTITHDMYTQMMQLIYQFGRYKSVGTA